VALAECCFNPEERFGARITMDTTLPRIEQILFNESQSRAVISVAEKEAAEVLNRLSNSGVAALRLGETGGEILSVVAGRESVQWAVAELFDDWYYSIERLITAE
jgi:phosphoribosylformylglycinamidine (FGAM) synthase-like enzyme